MVKLWSKCVISILVQESRNLGERFYLEWSICEGRKCLCGVREGNLMNTGQADRIQMSDLCHSNWHTHVIFSKRERESE